MKRKRNLELKDPPGFQIVYERNGSSPLSIIFPCPDTSDSLRFTRCGKWAGAVAELAVAWWVEFSDPERLRTLGGSGGGGGGIFQLERAVRVFTTPKMPSKLNSATLPGWMKPRKKFKNSSNSWKNRKHSKTRRQNPKGAILSGPLERENFTCQSHRRGSWCPVLSVSGSEFVEMFVGVGSSRVRDLFSKPRSWPLHCFHWWNWCHWKGTWSSWAHEWRKRWTGKHPQSAACRNGRIRFWLSKLSSWREQIDRTFLIPL